MEFTHVQSMSSPCTSVQVKQVPTLDMCVSRGIQRTGAMSTVLISVEILECKIYMSVIAITPRHLLLCSKPTKRSFRQRTTVPHSTVPTLTEQVCTECVWLYLLFIFFL
jgi:hypothetical protein